MDVDYRVSRFDGAVRFLPPRIREEIRKLPKIKRADTEEIRLRVGQTPTVLTSWGEERFSDEKVTKAELDALSDIATRASSHSVYDSMKNGFVTVRGGYRIGFGGSMLIRNGEVSGFREISSAVIRISKEIIGISESVYSEIIKDGKFSSALIISPPGGGKTTLLRDLVRLVSYGGYRVSVIDERSEIAAMYGGVPQFDVGDHTDVLEGCPKDVGITSATRALNPQIVAVDEITDVKDVKAVMASSCCGVEFLATAHARNIEDLSRRPVYRELISSGVFGLIVLIEKTDSGFIYRITKAVTEYD